MRSESPRTTELSAERTGSRARLFTDPTATLLDLQDVVGRKWHLVLVYHLLETGPQGFSALKERIDGISSKMLSESLEDLEDRGIVTRELLSERPVRVEYDLTERGAALEPLVTAMVAWGTEYGAEATGETDTPDTGETAGEPVDPTSETAGEPVDPTSEAGRS